MEQDILVVIQARFDSKRLLGKILLPLGGVPMLVYLIRRLKDLPSSYKVVVATTNRPEDDPVAARAREEDNGVVRGEDEDVLARYVRCLIAFPSPVIVRVTADNPLTEPRIIKDAVRFMKKGRYDYVNATKGYPVGAGVDVFTEESLRRVDESASSPYEREHINAYILDHPQDFNIGELTSPDGSNHADLRLTVDTEYDYRRVKRIVEYYPTDYFIRIEDAIERTYKRDI